MQVGEGREALWLKIGNSGSGRGRVRLKGIESIEGEIKRSQVYAIGYVLRYGSI